MKSKKMSKALKTSTISQSVFIKAPPEKVYEAYINPRIHSTFTGAKATGAPRVGSSITAWDGYITGKNMKLQKGKLIIQKWRSSEFPKEYKSSTLKISLKRKGKGTQLTMVHSEIPKSRQKDLSSGWQKFYWKPLKKYFDDK